MNASAGTGRRTLGCQALTIAYDFGFRYGQLEVGPLQCPDMTGCIELFKNIDPKVQVIDWESSDDSGRYELTASGWVCTRDHDERMPGYMENICLACMGLGTVKVDES